MTATSHSVVLTETACSLHTGEIERWQVAVDRDDAASWNPFREALAWPLADRVIVGAGQHIHVLHLPNGELDTTWPLAPDLFGHLALAEVTPGTTSTELLLVLGWTGVRAYGPELRLRWHTRDLAVDGITFDHAHGSRIHLHAEMDPPGGWFAVTLDATTGEELVRTPDFSEDYVGLYGRGSHLDE